MLSLVERSLHMLDKTHLVLCMKRLFTLSTSQHCDADVLRHDHRFQVLPLSALLDTHDTTHGLAISLTLTHDHRFQVLPLSLSITRHTRHDTHSIAISLTLTHDHRFQVLPLSVSITRHTDTPHTAWLSA